MQQYSKGKELSNIITQGYGTNVTTISLKKFFNINHQNLHFNMRDRNLKFSFNVLKLKFKIKVINDKT